MRTDTQWTTLIDLLERERQLYGDLKRLIEREAEALMRPDLPLFTHLLAEKQALVEQVQQLESERAGQIEDLAASRPHRVAKMRLKELIPLAPPVFAARLERCRRELVALMRALESRNQLHKKMLDHSREWAGNALNLLGNQLYVQPTYQANGNLSGAGRGGFVLSGVA